METLRYKEIKGFKIVVGYDQLQIDPIATSKNAERLMLETEEHKAFQKALEDMGGTPKDMEQLEQLSVLRHSCVQLFDKTRKENPVYFSLRKNELPLNPDLKKQLVEQSRRCKQGQAINVDGEIVTLFNL